jgi:hypothetical protein
MHLPNSSSIGETPEWGGGASKTSKTGKVQQSQFWEKDPQNPPPFERSNKSGRNLRINRDFFFKLCFLSYACVVLE